MFGATFNLVTSFGLPQLFVGLQINNLTLNNGFSYRNVFQNGVNALSRMVLKKSGSLSKCSGFRVVLIIRFCSNFTYMWYKYLRNVCREFRFSMSVLATVAQESFNDKFTAKMDFQLVHYRLPLIMLILKV